MWTAPKMTGQTKKPYLNPCNVNVRKSKPKNTEYYQGNQTKHCYQGNETKR